NTHGNLLHLIGHSGCASFQIKPPLGEFVPHYTQKRAPPQGKCKGCTKSLPAPRLCAQPLWKTPLRTNLWKTLWRMWETCEEALFSTAAIHAQTIYLQGFYRVFHNFHGLWKRLWIASVPLMKSCGMCMECRRALLGAAGGHGNFLSTRGGSPQGAHGKPVTLI
ncbi:MAG: hypothetical protein PHY12_13260, partial [Eubacteriales bacterium]|nr:hypothetical protein [Eubacteriales bacterium]